MKKMFTIVACFNIAGFFIATTNIASAYIPPACAVNLTTLSNPSGSHKILLKVRRLDCDSGGGSG